MNRVPNLNQSFNQSLGIAIPLTIILLWATSLVVLLSIDWSGLPGLSILGLILLRTFLQTGLFITAHDAMHGAIAPENPKLNHLFGRVSTTLYAFLAYRTLLNNHGMHHRKPASNSDPDFHDGDDNLVSWYLNFMKGYLNPKQIWIVVTGIVMVIAIFKSCLHCSNSNLMLFWLLPMVLSSVQLFYFGTFLPHRQPPQGYTNLHRASSTTYSVFWSFITCYHFGYHWEHHEYPDLPWYKLPILRTSIPLPSRESVGIITKLDIL